MERKRRKEKEIGKHEASRIMKIRSLNLSEKGRDILDIGRG